MAEGQAGDVAALLRRAAEVVVQADLPHDLRPVAFARVLDLQMARAATPATPTAPEPQAPGPRATTPAARADPVAALSRELKLDRDLVEQVFDFDGDTVQLTVATSDLARSQRDASGQVAYLMTAALQASGLVESAPIQVIKDACEQCGVLDAPNFSRALAKIKGRGISERGKGKDRSYRINRRGYEIAAEIVTAITAPSS
jgi:hypothetical protein